MKKITTAQKINKHTAKVIAALISNGYYNIKIDRKDDCCELTFTEIRPSIITPYTFCRVYEDGIVHYFIGNSVAFEGSTKNMKTIMMDVLHK